MGTRLAFTADAQIGARYGGIPDALAEQEAIVRTIFETARAEDCAAILLGGDTFEHRNPSDDARLAFERVLVEHKALAPGIPVVAIAGNHCLRNHDMASAMDVFALAGLLSFVREPCSTPLGSGVYVACLPWASTAWLRAQAGGGAVDDVNAAAAEHLLALADGLHTEILRHAHGDFTSLLLTHFAIDGTLLPNGQVASAAVLREPVLDAHALAGIGFDAVLAGHLQKPGFVLEQPCPVLYAGSPHPMDHGESGFDHGMWILDIDPSRGGESDGSDGQVQGLAPVGDGLGDRDRANAGLRAGAQRRMGGGDPGRDGQDDGQERGGSGAIHGGPLVHGAVPSGGRVAAAGAQASAGGVPGRYARTVACEFRPLQSRDFLTMDVQPQDIIDAPDECRDTWIPTDPAGAIVRVRITATTEQRRRISERAVTAALYDAGAAAVDVKWIPVREERQQTAGLREDLTDGETVELWLVEHGYSAERRAHLHELDRRYAGEAT